MRWDGQLLDASDGDALPGMQGSRGLVRTFDTPEFRGMEFLEVTARSALNKVPGNGFMGGAWTVNPYRGCQHACVYCVSPDTLVLMADGRQRQIRELKVGEEVIGTELRGAYRRYTRTIVMATWSTRKRAFRVTLADGTELVASGDHRFLTERGWKYVVGRMGGGDRRPYLTTSNRLRGFGSVAPAPVLDIEDPHYRRGYLAGMIRGDGMIFHGSCSDARTRRLHGFRLALADSDALDRTRSALVAEGIVTHTRAFSAASATRREMNGIHTGRRADVAAIERLIETPRVRTHQWSAGFLAGIFDAEGSCSRGILRVSNKDDEIIRLTCEAMSVHEITHVVEPANANGVQSVRVIGGLPARQRLSAVARPAIARTMSIEGMAVKSVADLRVVGIADLGVEIEMVDITTGTGDFIANGVISHNCFARSTHTYLDLDAGADFDSRVVVKTNVAEALDAELRRRRRERPEKVMLGTNTDPYQRAEGRYRLMPGVIDTLAKHRVGISILTKGTLLRRDLPRLVEAAERVPVDLSMSIAIFDDALQASVEPGTPTTAARLATVRAVRDAGLACGVLMMPVLPWLTDSEEHLDRAFAMLAEAGATSVNTTALHLRPGAREWYLAWLAREHPHLVSRYESLYAGGANASRDYQDWLSERVRTVRRRHRLDVVPERRYRGAPRVAAEAREPEGVTPTLF